MEFASRDDQEEAICAHTQTPSTTHKHLLHNTQGIVEFASRDDQEEAIAKLDDKEFKNNFDGSRTYLTGSWQ